MQGLNLEEVDFLVIEDNAFMRSLIKTVLRTLRVGTIKEAVDGADALKLMQSGFSPDIILLDWEMPALDGIEFTKILRSASDSQNQFAPVIMVSSYSDLNHVMQARDSGVNEFLAKPVSAKELYRRIYEVISHPRSFVKAKSYTGPCRRRKFINELPYEDRRQHDNHQPE